MLVEPCADYRNEICIQGKINSTSGEDFSSAACRVNRWQECTAQLRQSDCENTDRRDCMWLQSVVGLLIGSGSSTSTSSGTAATTTSSSTLTNPTATTTSFTNPTATGSAIAPITGDALFGGSSDSKEEKTTGNRASGVCVPSYPPGLKFWQTGEAESICSQASLKCVVELEQGLLSSSASATKNEECLTDDWAVKANNICKSLGDCGGYINYVGDYTNDGYLWKIKNAEKKFTPTQINQIKSPFTGKVIDNVLIGMVVAPITGMLEYTSNNPISGVDKVNSVMNPTETTVGTGAAPVVVKQAPAVASVANIAKAPISTALPKPLEITLTGTGDKFTTNSVLYNADKGTFSVLHNGENVPISADQLTSVGADPSVLAKAAVASQQPAFTGNYATLAEWFGAAKGSFSSAALGAIQYAAIAFAAGYLIGNLFGMSQKNSMALGLSLGAAAGVFEGIASYAPAFNQLGYLGAAGIGIGVGAAIFIFMYKKETTKVVTFQCLPWQPPRGSANCEVCNDPLKPCTEYRCKSLGGSCEIVNKGTADERCVSVNRNDVEPPVIEADTNVLTTGYKYVPLDLSPPSPGTKIININNTNGCVKPFTTFKFGIKTDEPAQCKVDFNHTTNIEQMTNWFGGTNVYDYNHSDSFVLPSVQAMQNSSLILQNGKDLLLFIRCRDKMNNSNPAEYAVKFCVDPSPDTTAPEIKATSIVNAGCVAETKDNALVNFYVNEPADCKWSHDDKSYSNMENTMSCASDITQINALQLYSCTANLTGIKRDLTNFYVRCLDQPGASEADRIPMQQSFVFTLRGSTALKLRTQGPNGTIYGSISPFPVSLTAETSLGCDNNKAICYYSRTDNDADYIQFFETNKDNGLHSQTLNLAEGAYTYFIKCVDSGGNVAKNMTTFTLSIDSGSPLIARIYQEGNLLKIRTVRNSECVYAFNNCDFAWQEATPMPNANTTDHFADWKQDKTYYIKCRDEFRAESSDCSAVIQPTKNFL